MRRSLALAAMLVSLGGCADEPSDFDLLADDSREEITEVLEDAELDQVLLEAQPREAPAPFIRIGLVWDAPIGTDLEFATSSDGVTWSDWQVATVHDVEAEEATSFVGEIMVQGDLATHYKARATGGGVPTFLIMQFLETPLVTGLEPGEPVEVDEDAPADVTDPDGDGIASSSFALSYGRADVNPRSAWGARAPRCRSYHSPNRITVHHTVTPTNDSMSPQARLRQIQAYHQNVQGWCDIGYHFLVSRDGRLWEGRPAGNLGAHVANNNTGNLGISYMGTYTATRVNDAQADAGAALLKGLGSRFGIGMNSSRIKGHRQYGGTSCPGDALFGQLGSIIRKAQGSVSQPSQPPPSGGHVVKGLIYRGNDPRRRIAGAMVHVGLQTVATNADGYYEVRNVPAGDTVIYASASGYVREKIRRTVSGSVTWGSIGLAPASQGTAVLQGVVYRGSNANNRVANAQISLSNGRTATTDGNGFYKITGLAPGSVKITATKSGVGTGSINRTLVNARITWGSVSL